jgi:hypothetical protein
VRRFGSQLLAVGAAVAILLGACGDEESEPEQPAAGAEAKELEPEAKQRLTAAERDRAFDAQRTLSIYCARLGAALVGERRPPSEREEREAFEAVDFLVRLAHEKPAARVLVGVETGLFASDVAENLEGLGCDPRLVAELERGVATAPAP